MPFHIHKLMADGKVPKREITIGDDGCERFVLNRALVKAYHYARAAGFQPEELWEDYPVGGIGLRELMEFYQLTGYSVDSFEEVFGRFLNEEKK